MSLASRNALLGHSFPQDFPCLDVEGIHLPGIVGIVLLRLPGSGDRLTILKRQTRRVAGDRRRDENTVAPNHGTREAHAGDWNPPLDVGRLLGVPGNRWIGTIRDSRPARATKRRPVLSLALRRHSCQKAQYSQSTRDCR